MKRMGFAIIPDRPHYWLADARAQTCLIEGSPPGKPDFEGLVRCDIEIKDGRIAAIGKAGNPDVQPNVATDPAKFGRPPVTARPRR